MEPELVAGNVRADCPDCGVPTTFEYRDASGKQEFGSIIEYEHHMFKGGAYTGILYKLLRCVVCARPGVAKLHIPDIDGEDPVLEWFWPGAAPREQVPDATPEKIEKELREAESCMKVCAWRAAAAMLRSTLEKTLIANGYDDRTLYNKIEATAADGAITAARMQRAHDLVRILGNDVLHDEWREVTRQEAEDAHRYVARIIEDFYDDRETVKKLLKSKGKKVS